MKVVVHVVVVVRFYRGGWYSAVVIFLYTLIPPVDAVTAQN